MGKEMDAGERLFTRWLDECGYPFDFEPSDWGAAMCPDFRVRHPDGSVAVEVESIAGWGCSGT